MVAEVSAGGLKTCCPDNVAAHATMAMIQNLVLVRPMLIRLLFDHRLRAPVGSRAAL
jgi:hypothetical protein